MKSEEIGPHTAKMIICKCGIEPKEKEGNVVLITGVSQGGVRIPELVSQIANDNTVNVIIENGTDATLVAEESNDIGETLPQRKTAIEGKKAYEPIPDPDVISFLHDEKLRNDILLGTENGVLPMPAGYDQEEPKEKIRIDFSKLKTPGLNHRQRRKLIRILERFRGVLAQGPETTERDR